MSQTVQNESELARQQIEKNVERTAHFMQAAFLVSIVVAAVATVALFL